MRTVKGGRVLVALGGNAILKHTERGTAEEQIRNIRVTSKRLAEIVREGNSITVTHGNGPQVGDILLRNEFSKSILPPMPIDVCGAESQGMIGYFLQQTLHNELAERGLAIPVATILTQTIVDEDDPAFSNPSKPIGPFYTALEASKMREERGWEVMNDSGRGWRRAVPSPMPVSIVEAEGIKELVEAGCLVIACGGGGVPVVRTRSGELRGVEAVVDKDHSAAILAKMIGADTLLILTDVEGAFSDYGKRGQQLIPRMTVVEAKEMVADGTFAGGSMRPKVESAVQFLEQGGKRAIITCLECALAGLGGKRGTTIVP
ncbi:MAG: carbamate kinase [Methanomassiliicoccales archaeon]|nr:carbamate kinase [Methanomassiliicoccales archaeon]